MNKIYVLEGTDGSGKTTQFEKTRKVLEENGIIRDSDCFSFPNYKANSSYFVREYLGDAYGYVNPKLASSFYLMDQFDSISKATESTSSISLFSRYWTSNLLYQTTKLKNSELLPFLDWYDDMVQNVYQLPAPSKVFLLDMPPEKSLELRTARGGSDAGVVDIHEADDEMMLKSYEMSIFIARRYNWDIISCTENNQIRSVDSINEELVHKILLP